MIPQRGSETFTSIIGHIDGRLNLLYNTEILTKEITRPDDFVDKNVELGMGHRALMGLCMMSSKLAYENENVVKNLVNHHWKVYIILHLRLYYSYFLDQLLQVTFAFSKTQMHFVDFYNCWNGKN